MSTIMFTYSSSSSYKYTSFWFLKCIPKQENTEREQREIEEEGEIKKFSQKIFFKKLRVIFEYIWDRGVS